jgi:ribosomal protein S27E
MDEYASLRKIEFELCGGNLPEKYKKFIRRVLNDRNLIPAADVAPVVHGRWMHSRYEDCSEQFKRVKCSQCNQEAYAMAFYVVDGHYCPNCGAKMDGWTT